MTFKITAAIAATALIFAAAPAIAQQGTTLAGPAQGQKSDGSASTTPSGQSGANGGGMMKSDGGAMTGTGGAPAQGGAMTRGNGAESGASTTR